MASQQDALSQLAELTDAGSGRSLVELGWIQQLRLEGNRAVFRLALPASVSSASWLSASCWLAMGFPHWRRILVTAPYRHLPAAPFN